MANKNNEIIAQAQAQAIQSLSDRDTFRSAMLGLAPVADKDTEVKVGEKALTSTALKQVTVTARTLQYFRSVSAQALACELSALDKAEVAKDGFKSVSSFIGNVFPDLAQGTAMEYYRVGRVFGDRTTHKWRNGYPEDVSITNLSSFLKYLGKVKSIDTMTQTDLVTLANDLYDKYIATDLVHLRLSNKALREEMDAILNPPVDTTFEEVDTDEQGDQGEQGEQGDQDAQAQAEDVLTRETALKALDTLYTYFRGNADVLALIAQVQAYVPAPVEVEVQDDEQ